MLSRVCSAALNGIEAFPVEVEVNAGYGDTLVVIVGLPDAAVKESRVSNFRWDARPSTSRPPT
jgi:magnesium chelatase family protein